MRLIGNKTKLLGSIQRFLEARGVHGGTFFDVFAGTGSVGRHFRRLGYRVRANDLLWSSYVRQLVYVGCARVPDFSGLLELPQVRRRLAGRRGRAEREALGTAPPGQEDLYAAVAALALARPRRGLIWRQYAEGGPAGRLYFSDENGRRIDGAHEELLAWRRDGRVGQDGFWVLLASLLEAADRVANISGTYGAFLKRLQESAREPLRLRPPLLDLRSPAGRVYRGDANALVRRVSADVLYLDPPYNQRQYAKNYHVPEVLAELHTATDLRAYEAEIYGKTGLRRFEDRRSEYCRRGGRRGGPSPCEKAFRDLVRAARAEHIVVSYSEEGILDREAIGAALAEAAGLPAFDFERDHRVISHRRFRSDRNRNGRVYRVLEGRAPDEVGEWLFYVRKPRSRRRASA